MIVSGVLYVCVSLAIVGESHNFNDPEDGIGHVAFSRSIPFVDLERESLAECEVAHGQDECTTYCYESRVCGDE